MDGPLDELLYAPEGKTLEFKRDLSSPHNVIKTLVAFGNSAGGRLILGIANDRQRIGVESRLESRLQLRLESKSVGKVILLLKDRESGKAQSARVLGHGAVSGELHKQIRRLMEQGMVEMTLPRWGNHQVRRRSDGPAQHPDSGASHR